MNSRNLALAVLLATSLAPAAVFAQAQPERTPGGEEVVKADPDAPGDANEGPGILLWRVWGDSVDSPAFAGDAERRTSVNQLLRTRIGIGDETLALVTEFDVLAGRIGGDAPPTVPDEADSGTRPGEQVFDAERFVLPRQMYGQWRSPVGQIRGGLQLSQWGLGILANNGSADTEGLFNQHFGGDRVLRAVFATAPLRAVSDGAFAKDFYLALGGDVVWRDENADLFAGDQAFQGVLAALYDTEQTKGGAYIVYRDQTDRDDDFLEIFAADLYADHTWQFADDWTLRTAGEGAFITGRTNRTITSAEAEPVDVLGLGVATEFEVRYEPVELGLQLLGGYASGDANTDDDTLYRFRFDPNYNVGLVLFNHYLPAVTRANLEAIDDPTRSGQPPKGVGGLVNDGGIENAFYLSPRVVYGDPEEGLHAGLGALWAQAAEPVYDPYQTFLNGGIPTGIRGRTPASTDLGLEVDAAVQYRFNPIDELTLELRGEGGVLFPGEAFATASGESDEAQSLMRLRAGVMW